MRKFHGDYYQVYLDEFMSVVKNLFQFYASSKPANSKSSVNENNHSSPADPLVENQDAELERFLYNDNGASNKELNELDKYMAESLTKQNPFDILSYWKNSINEYPIFSQIARDMMAIQVSCVCPGRSPDSRSIFVVFPPIFVCFRDPVYSDPASVLGFSTPAFVSGKKICQQK